VVSVGQLALPLLELHVLVFPLPTGLISLVVDYDAAAFKVLL